MYTQTRNDLELSKQDSDPTQIDAAPPGGLAAMDEEENPHDGPGLIKLDMTLRPRVGDLTS